MKLLRLLVCVMIAGCAAQAGPLSSLDTSANLYHSQILAPRVYVMTQGDTFHLQPRGNVEIIEQADGVVLVDSGGSPAGADEVIDFIRSRTRAPVKAIVLTHWHGDHVLGVSRLLEIWPHARVISTRETRDMLASPQSDRFMPGDDAAANARFQQNLAEGIAFLHQQSSNASLDPEVRSNYGIAAREYERFARDMAPAHRVAPNETFDRELVLDDPTVPIHVLFLGRANTSGDAVVWLPRQRVAITGDIMVRPIPYGFNSYPTEWIQVLDQIDALRPAVLAPGHGEPMRSDSYLRLLRSMLSDVRRQLAALGPLETIADADAVQRVDLSSAEERLCGDDPWLRRWFDRYWKEPIVSSALKEARGQPIVQGAS